VVLTNGVTLVSLLGDCLKLIESERPERKGVVVFTYEHNEPIVDLNILIRSFELLAKDVLRVNLGIRCTAKIHDLVHPEHQQGTVYGWELLGNYDS
jgi:hypothetical protein